MKVVILQPSYIPWRGYFDQIDRADLFIFYDDVQYDRRSWRNRNKIKTGHGAQWLSIPVYSHGAQTQNIPINQICICFDNPWHRDHWNSILHSYRKAPFFLQFSELIESFYNAPPERLADFTIQTTIALARAIGIDHTSFLRSSEIPDVAGAKTDRLINILKKVGATHYISGPSAKDYIENEKFAQAGISLEYMAYNYPAYPQLYPPFDPQISIIDLMFMCGPNVLKYIRTESL